MFEFSTFSPEETAAAGKRLGALCRGGETLLLNGPLGAGKTCFLQGLARGLEVPDGMEVVSPTFVIHCQYPGRLTFNHIDAYRLRHASDIDGLGFEEYFADAKSVNAIEWAEIVEGIFPDSYLAIEIVPTGESERKFSLCAKPEGKGAHAELLEKFAAGGKR